MSEFVTEKTSLSSLHKEPSTQWPSPEPRCDQALVDITTQRVQMESLEAAVEASAQENNRLYHEIESLQAQLRHSVAEQHALLFGLERRVGELLLDRCHLRSVVRAIEWIRAKMQRHKTRLGLYVSRWFSWPGHSRILAMACSNFPIYSQTFVHQELSQLANHGFRVQLAYSFLESKENLSAQCSHLWKAKSRLALDPSSHQKDFERYRARVPGKVDYLIQRLAETSGLTAEGVIQHPNFLQAFSYTQLVEAYRPQYLHSYFFYDRSLMTLVASYVLEIPRGISCYADHVLKDYDLKVVPLHLELCDLVIATSERIKSELLVLAPQADPARIIVKPNAIDTKWFPPIQRPEPTGGEPFRLVCVNRIEPKKGLLYLVEAIHHLRQRGYHVELHIIGTADSGVQSSQDYKQKLNDCITRHNLWGKVHLEGQHNQEGVLRFLTLSQVFVAPFVETDYGDKDGIPTALLEAMATGLPVVATDAGSIGEVIQHGREGEVVPQRDSVALADSLARLLSDSQRRNDLGRAAIETVQQRFDVRVCEHRFHDRVRSVIGSSQLKRMSPSPLNVTSLPEWMSRVFSP